MSLNPRRATFRGNVAPGARVKPSYLHGRWSSDDLNYLFHRQQVELSRSATASSPAARIVHNEFARLYEQAIEQVTGGKIRFWSGPIGRLVNR